MPKPLKPDASLASLLEHIHVGVLVYSPKGRVTLANDYACRLMGLSEDQMVGRGMVDPDWPVVGEDGTPVALDTNPVVQVLETGESVSDVVFGVDRPDKADRMWLLVSVFPELGDTGETAGAVVTFTDITEQRRVAEDLRLHKTMLEEMGRVAKVGGWRIDAATGAGFWTEEAARIHDLDPSHPMSMNAWFTYYTAESRPVIQAAVKDAVEHGIPYDLELQITSAAGVRKSVRVIGHPVIEAGRVARVTGSIQDVSDQRQAEEAARESEERFWRAFHASPACQMISTLEDGTIVDVNDAFCAMLGYKREELLGQTSTELDLFPDPEARDRGAAELQARGRLHGREVELRTKSGDIRHLVGSVEPIEWKGTASLIWVALDITERRNAERATAQALETNRAIVENAPIGVAIFRATGEYVTANEAAARLLGTTPELLQQENCFQLESGKRSGLYEAARRALATGRPMSIEDEISTVFGAHLWMRIVFKAYESGGEQYLMMMMEDFTERKNAELAVRHSEARFRTLVDGAPDGVYVEREGRFDYLNPAMARLLGAASPEALIGTEILARVAPEHRDTVRARLRKVHETKLPAPPNEIDYLRLDGSRLAVETSVVLLPSDGGGSQLVFVRDRTEQRKADADRAALQEQLLQAQKMESVGQLAGGIAHDFNNILMVQRGYLEMMRLTLKEGDPIADGLAQIEAYAERATELTRQLLAFSRKQPLHPVVLDLNYLLEESEPMLRRLMGENIEVVTVPAAHPAQVEADRAQLEQVLINLAVGSRDAMPKGGRLTLEASWADVEAGSAESERDIAPGPYILLAVRDTGRGMDAETARRIFEPFFVGKGQSQGTGLGLSAVYGIVRQSGGDILVDSELGKGATFRIYLPRVEVSVAAPGGAAESMAEQAGPLVLVVEDEPALRGLVVAMIEKMGYVVKEAANGGQALALVEREGLVPDLLLTDVVMPEMSGSVLAERLRGRMPGLKVIYMSGYADDTILDYGVVDPNVDFLRKPFSMASLETRITKVLGPLEK